MRTLHIAVATALAATGLAGPAQAGWRCEATVDPGTSSAETRAYVEFNAGRTILPDDSGVMWIPSVTDPQDRLDVRFRYGVGSKGARSASPDRFVVFAYLPLKTAGWRLQLSADGVLILDAPLADDLIPLRAIAFETDESAEARIVEQAAAARRLDVRLNASDGYTMVATTVDLATRQAREADVEAALTDALARLQRPDACVQTQDYVAPSPPEGMPSPLQVAPPSTWSGPSGGR